MKNIVRALALALVATGAVASAHTTSASAKVNASSRTGALPVPTCPWNDPTGCGICQFNGSCGK